ncbi:MAG: ATP-binding cassette domain-containing protein [Lysobacteraceae bacterium]
MISFRNFALRRGTRLLLSQVDVTLHAGWRVGVVGRNGAGKSSLFAALSGELEADAGDLDLPSRLAIAQVAQETPALPDPALDFVLGGDTKIAALLREEAEAAARGDYEAVAVAHQHLAELPGGYDAQARAGRLLHGLGFSPDTHGKAVAEFSGGWRVRLNLARALMMPSELLLLDEPTNHLDLDAVLWLEQWLLKYEGTLFLISHDREFLDGVCTHILHLHDGRAKLYVGNYTAFERQRAEQLRQQQIAHEKEQTERAHLQKFIDRFKAKASKARQAQSRMKRLEKLAGTEAVRAERALTISFAAPQKLPATLIRLNDAQCGYVADDGQVNAVLRNVCFGLESGDRIGLLGPNGAGKSTLVKTLVGDLPLLAGERNAHPDMRIGYFAQHTVESLHEGMSPVWHLKQIAPEMGEQVFRDFLGRWNFAGNRAFESIDGFSGGERARLALALIAWRQPNVLLLDEPTNHLDLDMREALAEALSDFDGAIVLVSHDRHLIGLVCDTFWRVAGGKVEEFDGDLDAYAAWLRSRPGTDAAAEEKARPAVKTAPAKPVPQRETPEQRQAKNRLRRVEEQMAKKQAELEEITAKLADPELYENGGGGVNDLVETQRLLQHDCAELESRWLELYERAEGASA